MWKLLHRARMREESSFSGVVPRTDHPYQTICAGWGGRRRRRRRSRRRRKRIHITCSMVQLIGLGNSGIAGLMRPNPSGSALEYSNTSPRPSQVCRWGYHKKPWHRPIISHWNRATDLHCLCISNPGIPILR